MKLIFGIILTIGLISCKSTKDCNCSYVVDKDTVIIVTEPMKFENKYLEGAVYETVIIDTVMIKM